MDRTLVIYDLTGRVLSIVYGATADEVPQGVPSLWCDIPPGAVIDYVDVANNEVVFKYLPETDLGKIQSQIQHMSDFVSSIEGTITETAQNSADANATARLAAENAVSAREAADSAALALSGQSDDITALQEALVEVYEMLIGGEV